MTISTPIATLIAAPVKLTVMRLNYQIHNHNAA